MGHVVHTKSTSCSALTVTRFVFKSVRRVGTKRLAVRFSRILVFTGNSQITLCGRWQLMWVPGQRSSVAVFRNDRRKRRYDTQTTQVLIGNQSSLRLPAMNVLVAILGTPPPGLAVASFVRVKHFTACDAEVLDITQHCEEERKDD